MRIKKYRIVRTYKFHVLFNFRFSEYYFLIFNF